MKDFLWIIAVLEGFAILILVWFHGYYSGKGWFKDQPRDDAREEDIKP